MHTIRHIIAFVCLLTAVGISACAPTRPGPLASTEWLAAHLEDPSMRIVDGRRPPAFLDGEGREGYQAGHIPGAVYLDIRDELSDPDSSVPVMIIPPDGFEELMGRLGIDESTTVVVYDQKGGRWAARVWWALRYHGHDAVKILDGGLTKWSVEDRPLESGVVSPTPTTFSARVRPELLSTTTDVEAALDDPDVCLIDALPRWRHLEGHIPSAHNLPATANLDTVSQTMRPVDELEELWQQAGLEPHQSAITYCVGGYYGAFDLFVLHLLGHEHVSLYDGSMLDWTSDPDRPVEVGDPLNAAQGGTR